MAQHVTYCHLIPMMSWYSWLALAIPGSQNNHFLANSLEKIRQKLRLFTTIKPVYNGHLGKRQGDRQMQGDRYIQVNFVENIRQLKIFGKLSGDRNRYRVTVIYRAVIYTT